MNQFAFDMEMRRMRKDTGRKKLDAASSGCPRRVRLAAYVADYIGSPAHRSPHDEHRLSAEQLGVGQSGGR